MSPLIVGIIGIFFLFLLLALRMQIGFSMALVGFLGFAVLSSLNSSFSIMGMEPFKIGAAYSLTVIPLFILMGQFASHSKMGFEIYQTVYRWIGFLPGGLSMATIGACGGFAAISGSSLAAAANMGMVALPEMKRFKYDNALATGCVAAGGTLGILIPPSTVMIIYGILTEQPIASLFIAGILPGVLLSLLFVAVVALLCLRNPHLGPPGTPTSWKAKVKAGSGIFEAVILFFLAIGGLLMGWFSPTQAGAIGAGGCLFIGLIRRQLTWRSFFEAGKDGLRTGCMVLCIITGAVIFGHFMAVSTIPFLLADWVGNLPIHRMAIMGVIIFIYFLWLNAAAPSLVISKKPVRKLEDLKGLSIRAPGVPGEIISALGGTPAPTPMMEVYDALAKGVNDGVYTPYETIKTFRFAEVVDYTTISWQVGNTYPFYVAMNKNSYKKLPPDLKEIFDNLCGEYRERYALMWNEIDIVGKNFGAKKGVEYIELSDAEAAKWKKAVESAIDGYIKMMVGKGFSESEVRGWISFLRERIDYYTKKQIEYRIPSPTGPEAMRPKNIGK